MFRRRGLHSRGVHELDSAELLGALRSGGRPRRRVSSGLPGATARDAATAGCGVVTARAATTVGYSTRKFAFDPATSVAISPYSTPESTPAASHVARVTRISPPRAMSSPSLLA